MEKKRYILFSIIDYYPSGGMDDMAFTFDSLEELKIGSKHMSFGDYQVFDTETFKFGEGNYPKDAFSNLVNWE